MKALFDKFHHAASSPLGDDPFTVHEGIIVLHVIPMDPVSITNEHLALVAGLLGSYNTMAGARDVKLAKILTKDEWDGREWTSEAAISLEFRDEVREERTAVEK